MLSYDFISDKYLDEINAYEGKSSQDESSVELYLKEKALKLHSLNTAITRLYFNEEDQLVGFFTLHNDTINIYTEKREELNEKYGWEFPDDDTCTFPSIKLHYLGVDAKYRGKGYGLHLMNETLTIAHEVAENSGCMFLTVEALHSASDFYRKRGFKGGFKQTSEFEVMVFKLGEVEEEVMYEETSYSSKTMQILKDKIIHYRFILGWDHETLALKADLDEADIEEFEFGNKDPGIDMIRILSEAMGVPFKSLFD